MGLPFLIARGSDGQQEIRRFETFMQMTNIYKHIRFTDIFSKRVGKKMTLL